MITDLARYMSRRCRRRAGRPGLGYRGDAQRLGPDAGLLRLLLLPVSTNPTFTPTVQANLGSGFNFPGAVADRWAGDFFVADTGNNADKELLPRHRTIGSDSTPGRRRGGEFGESSAPHRRRRRGGFPNGAIRPIGSG